MINHHDCQQVACVHDLESLESQLSQVQGELEQQKWANKVNSDESKQLIDFLKVGLEQARDDISGWRATVTQYAVDKQTAESERDSLKAENEKLKTNKHLVTSDEGTSYCAQCERYARERDKYKAVLEDITGHCCHPDCNHQDVVKQALQPRSGE